MKTSKISVAGWSAGIVSMAVVAAVLTAAYFAGSAGASGGPRDQRQALSLPTRDIEGTWVWTCCRDKSGKSLHSGKFIITQFTDGYRVSFQGEHDNPKGNNGVDLSGDSITLNRDLSPYKAPDDGQSSQTWTGTVSTFNNADGNQRLKIEGSITGASMTWMTKNGYDTNFTALK
jgi:hypothetical protein